MGVTTSQPGSSATLASMSSTLAAAKWQNNIVQITPEQLLNPTVDMLANTRTFYELTTTKILYRSNGITLIPFKSARLHGDIRALMLAPTTKASVHAASSIVSTGAGRLFGIWVIHPGASPTIKVWDNASAASGKILRDTIASEITTGGFIYCGPDGMEVQNGIYLELGGATAPIVWLAFEGTYPAVSYTGTIRYFDGTDGNDSWDGTAPTYQGGTVGPKRSLYDFGISGASNWRFYFKRGTRVEQWRNTGFPGSSGSSLTFSGTNLYFGAYGDENLAKPVIFKTEATRVGGMSFEVTATSGNLLVEDIRFEFTGPAKCPGTGLLAVRGIKATWKRVEGYNYASGVVIGGDYNRAEDCATDASSNGFMWGSNSYAAPNYSLALRCVTTNNSVDAFSVHDGLGGSFGAGTVLVGCTGDCGDEAVLDVQPLYTSGMMAYCYGTRPSGVSSSGFAWGLDTGTSGTWSLIGNVVLDLPATSHSGLVLRGPGVVVVGNYFESAPLNNALVLCDTNLTGALILNNTFIQRAASTMANVIRYLAGSSGTFENNIVVSLATNTRNVLSAATVTEITSWQRNGNCWYSPNGTPKYSETGGPYMGAAAYLTAARTNSRELMGITQNPGLINAYQIAQGSTLSNAGTPRTKCYLGRFGPIWSSAAPPIGMYAP